MALVHADHHFSLRFPSVDGTDPPGTLIDNHPIDNLFLGIHDLGLIIPSLLDDFPDRQRAVAVEFAQKFLASSTVATALLAPYTPDCGPSQYAPWAAANNSDSRTAQRQ